MEKLEKPVYDGSMSVTLFRRHRAACKGSHPADSFTLEQEERRKGWKPCACKIYAHGTLAGVSKKFATRCRDFESAKEVIRPYLEAGRWDIDPDTPPPAPPAPSGSDEAPSRSSRGGLKTADAIRSFIAEHKAAQSADLTIRKYANVLAQFERFSKEAGVRFIEEWDKALVRRIVTGWGEAPFGERANQPTTIATKLGVLKTFFERWVDEEWIPSNPARIRLITNRARRKGEAERTRRGQKSPFTDQEIARMLTGCAGMEDRSESPNVVPIRLPNGGLRRYAGDDLADFINLSVHTGLRISDIALFDISRLTPAGEVKLRARKNGNWVSVWIPEWLQARIRLRAKRFGPRIFGPYATVKIESMTQTWRQRLISLWTKTGPWEKTPTPHRFRHTFVRVLLERHVPLAIVAELVGDTEEMIRRHYSDWVPGRQESMTRVLREAFGSEPRFHRH